MNKYIIRYFYIFIAIASLVGCTNTMKKAEVESTVTSGFNNNLINSIAVFVEGDTRNNYRSVEDEFVKALISKNYKVPARSDLKDILREQNFQGSDITNSAAARIGKILNVDAIIIVSIYDNTNEVGARMIDVNSSEILWIGKTSTGTYNFIKSRYLSIMIPPAPAPELSTKLIDHYFEPEGYYSKDFDFKNVDKFVVFIKGNTNHMERYTEDIIISQLMKNGYKVPSRSDLESVIKEIDFQSSDISDKTLSEIGKISNTRYVVIIWVNPVSENYINSHSGKDYTGKYYANYAFNGIATLRIIDLESSSIVLCGTVFKSSFTSNDHGLEQLKNDQYKNLVNNIALLLPKK
jgi:hypothetical protein